MASLVEQQCKELYETWQLLYQTYGDRGSAHLVWLDASPERVEAVAAYVRALEVTEAREGFTVEDTVYLVGVEAGILEGIAREIREERDPAFEWGY